MATTRIFSRSATAFLTAFIFSGTASAAGFSFDGSAGAAFSLDYSLPPAVAVTAPARAAFAAAPYRAYDFKALWKGLGYPAVKDGDGGEATAAFGATEDEIMDLTSYTSKYDPFYEEVNGYLRFYPAPYDWSGTSPQVAAAMVKNIDRVFTRVPALPADLMLFRGLNLKYRDSRPYAIGEEYVDKGYVSTSASYKVARYFAIEMNDNATTPSRKAVLAIYTGRAEKGILIDQREDEVILGHGRKFRVMAQKAGVAKYDLYLVQACSGSCSTTLPEGVKLFWNELSVQD